MTGTPTQRKRGRPPKDPAIRETAKPRKTGKRKFSEDKELMERLVAGVQVGGDLLDMGFSYGLGIRSGIWKFSETEAEVFARILARRADEGNQQAIAQVEKLVDYADYVQVASIVIGKTVDTVLEVKEHGFNPLFLRDTDSGKNSGKSGGGNSDTVDGGKTP